MIALATGGSLSYMWVLFNTLQLWFTFGLMQLMFPASIQIGIKTLEIVNFENPLTSGFTQLIFPGSFFIDDPYNPRFASLGMGNRFIVSNMADVLPTLFLSIFIFALCVLIVWIAKRYMHIEFNPDN